MQISGRNIGMWVKVDTLCLSSTLQNKTKKRTEKDSACSRVSETCMHNSERRSVQKAIRTNLHVHSSAWFISGALYIYLWQSEAVRCWCDRLHQMVILLCLIYISMWKKTNHANGKLTTSSCGGRRHHPAPATALCRTSNTRCLPPPEDGHNKEACKNSHRL